MYLQDWPVNVFLRLALTNSLFNTKFTDTSLSLGGVRRDGKRKRAGRRERER
jgi:hypothetical protein